MGDNVAASVMLQLEFSRFGFKLKASADEGHYSVPSLYFGTVCIHQAVHQRIAGDYHHSNLAIVALRPLTAV